MDNKTNSGHQHQYKMQYDNNGHLEYYECECGMRWDMLGARIKEATNVVAKSREA